jgi:hypothetical protein
MMRGVATTVAAAVGKVDLFGQRSPKWEAGCASVFFRGVYAVSHLDEISPK